jgi:vitamin B12 transporter
MKLIRTMPWVAIFAGTTLAAQTEPVVELAGVRVLSPRVANQEPSGTIAMPISGLRFEPQVDVQARNLAEGQADVSIRGGTFANTSFQLGALPLWDPQTGHYSAEIPIAPELLGPPQVRTGPDHARAGFNATVGSIHYGWRPIRTGGHVAGTIGEYSTYRAEAHVAAANARGFGADVALAHSVSDGSVPHGDHEFSRYNLRLQHRTETGQTDLFAGYQAKFFGWPNLYTPFNSPETENLQTVLFAASHRRDWGADDGHVEVGVFHRRNKDDYAFNRFAPVGPVHPFQHTTWVTGAGASGRWVLDDHWAVAFRGSALEDQIESTSLLFGRFSSRQYWSLGVFPEWRQELTGGRTLVVSAGASYDDTNRDRSALSPVVELAVRQPAAAVERWSLSYSQASQVADYTALNANPAAGLFRGNPNLGRATTHNLELAADYGWAGWQGRAAVFFRRDDDLLDWTFQRGVIARRASPVDIDTGGIELFARRSFGRWEIMLGYSWLEKNADYGATTVDGSFYALNYPKHRLTAAVVAQLGRGWEVRVDNEARLQADNPLRQRGGDEALLTSVGIYWRVPQVRGLQLSAQVDNLWNSNFEEVPAVPAARRLATLGARWSW